MKIDSRARYWLATLVWIWIPGLAAADEAAAEAAIERKDYELALQELQPLAESGNPIAQYNLGVLHQNGHGTKKAQKVAAGWFRKSADQGNAQAAFALGVMYGTGKGAKLDPIEAYAWFRFSARKGYEPASKNMHRITREMSLEQVMQARKLFDQRWAELSE
jgi:TPR repeat protein